MRMTKLLLAASMLVPAVAQAQEQGPEPNLDAGISRRGELRQMRDRVAREERAAPGDDGGRARGDVARDDRPAPQGFARPDRPDRPDVAAQRPDRPDVAAQRLERRPDRPDFGARRTDRPDFARRDDGQWRGDRRDARPNFAADRPDVRRPPAPPRSGQWNRNSWRDDDYARARFDDRRDWNRGWRSDSRYDWNRYRSVNRRAYSLPRYYAPSGWGYGYRRFSIGVRLSSPLWSENYWIDDPWAYRLPDAYGPYRWVRYYDDALLVDIRTGEVVDMVYGIFY